MEADCFDYLAKFFWGTLYFFASLATPLIAFLVFRVGREQKEIAARKLRLDLFEKKFAVFGAVQNLFGRTLDATLTYSDIIDFDNKTSAAVFLFSEGIVTYIGECRGNASSLITGIAKYKGQDPLFAKLMLIQLKNENYVWFQEQTRLLPGLFQCEMRV